MKKLALTCSICALGLLLHQGLMGQDSKNRSRQHAPANLQDSTAMTRDSAEKHANPKKSYWQGGLSYLSDNVYLGRKDSVKIPYIMPTIGYYHKSGLYADATLGYAALPDGNSHIDMFAIEAGYAITTGNFDGQIAASKYYYSSKSFSVRSEIAESIVADASYDLSIIKPSFEATFNFGSQTDYVTTWGLQHTFYTAGDALDITPTVQMNSGTQNYYDSYYKKRKYSRTRKGAIVKGTITATVLDPSAFKVLDYEAGVPINYTLGKFTFNFAPTLAIPVNPAQVTRITQPTGGAATTKVTSLEQLNNSFFWTLGFLVKF